MKEKLENMPYNLFPGKEAFISLGKSEHFKYDPVSKSKCIKVF